MARNWNSAHALCHIFRFAGDKIETIYRFVHRARPECNWFNSWFRRLSLEIECFFAFRKEFQLNIFLKILIKTYEFIRSALDTCNKSSATTKQELVSFVVVVHFMETVSFYCCRYERMQWKQLHYRKTIIPDKLKANEDWNVVSLCSASKSVDFDGYY